MCRYIVSFVNPKATDDFRRVFEEEFSELVSWGAGFLDFVAGFDILTRVVKFRGVTCVEVADA
jgi:hypothetical protein